MKKKTVEIKGRTYELEAEVSVGPASKANGHAAWFSLRGGRGAHFTLVQFADGSFRLHRGAFQGEVGDFLSSDVRFSAVAS